MLATCAHLLHAAAAPHHLQADKPNPSAAFADDESVIDRMVAQLEQATQGLPADYKLQPVQFEKVRSGAAQPGHTAWAGSVRICCYSGT
jgi:hypothetical protein